MDVVPSPERNYKISGISIEKSDTKALAMRRRRKGEYHLGKIGGCCSFWDSFLWGAFVALQTNATSVNSFIDDAIILVYNTGKAKEVFLMKIIA